MSHQHNLDSIGYIINGITITITKEPTLSLIIQNTVNNAKLNITENQFISLISIQELIKNGFAIFKSASNSNPHSELDNITPTIDLADVLSDCNIMQTDLLDFG